MGRRGARIAAVPRRERREHFERLERLERVEQGGAFVCARCGTTVAAEAVGTRQRNHCPSCLHSLHVDIAVGDRRSLCRGLMEPIGLWVRDDGEVSLLHRCGRCGVIKANRVAGDDDQEAIGALVLRVRRVREAVGPRWSRAAPAT